MSGEKGGFVVVLLLSFHGDKYRNKELCCQSVATS